MTFTNFHTLGNTPFVNDLFMSPVRTGAMTSLAWELALFVFLRSEGIMDKVDIDVIYRRNSDGRVPEVEVEEIFRRDFAKALPIDTKYGSLSFQQIGFQYAIFLSQRWKTQSTF